MSFEIMLPRITGTTPAQQLEQIKRYLYQMTEQVRFALNDLDNGNFSEHGKAQLAHSIRSMEGVDTSTQETQYQEVKALIVKTARTVESNYEELSRLLESEYVAKSDFGEFKQSAELAIAENSENITQYYTETNELRSSLDEASRLLDSYITDTSAYIRTGKLYENGDGVPVYGIELGQRSTRTIDGDEVSVMDNLVARFISNRLSFFQGNAEVAYVSNQRLYITEAHITGRLIVGDWKITGSDGFSLQYIGE